MKNVTSKYDNKGLLKEVCSEKAKLIINETNIMIDTDYGTFKCNNDLIYQKNPKNKKSEYKKSTPFGEIAFSILYSVENFTEYNISIYNEKEVVINKIWMEIQLNETPDEVFLYDTFKNASTFGLIRLNDISLFIGFTNPIFEINHIGKNVYLSFEPALKLVPGENFICDSLFIGSTINDQNYFKPIIPKTAYQYGSVSHTRYRNPSGHIALSISETRAFKQYVNYFLAPYEEEQKVVFYTYFCPFPRLINTEEDENTYYQYINNFKKIGGNMIIFNPIQRFVQPVPTNDSRWIIAPEGSRAKNILKYCQDNNIGYGFTWGSAVINTNSPMTSYSLIGEKNHWKKIGKAGELARENCICENDFYNWFKNVQINTINEEKILLWDWDPGPGIGSFCYSTNHGHLPGKGLYKGYRNSMRMIKEMKEACPDLLFQSFHGLKEYGLWGMKGINWHESYWEQDPYFFSASYPDLSADRYTADGMRLQCWWNHNFRFLPSTLNQFMSARMIQNCGSPHELRYLFDYYGYKYALMSAIACGGAITFPMLPYDFSICKEYESFMTKWIAWSKEHYHYNHNMYTFGNQVSVGGIDGYAKWKQENDIKNKNVGYIFLCNPAPYPVEANFELGYEIGFTGVGEYTIKELYPGENIYFFDDKLKKGSFKQDDHIHITVPSFQVILLEVSKAKSNQLYNIVGDFHIENDSLYISSKDRIGETRKLILKLNQEISHMYLNNQEIEITKEDDLYQANIVYGDTLIRNINQFTSSNNQYQIPFVFKNKQTYEAEFYVSNQIENIIKKSASELTTETIKNRQFAVDLNNNSYLWTFPDKVYGVLTFSDASNIDEIKLEINNQKIKPLIDTVPAHGLANPLLVGYYFDLTYYLNYGKINNAKIEINLKDKNDSNINFYGIQLYYGEGEQTTIIKQVKEEIIIKQNKEEKVFNQSSNSRIPQVLNAWIEEGYIEEYRSFTLCVDVNIPFEEIEGVYTSNPINIDDSKMTLMTDNYLNYDFGKRLWKKTFYMGSRQFLIVDEENIYVWVVTKNNSTSKTYKVKLDWKLF